jgi:hypothetical protein
MKFPNLACWFVVDVNSAADVPHSPIGYAVFEVPHSVTLKEESAGCLIGCPYVCDGVAFGHWLEPG